MKRGYHKWTQDEIDRAAVLYDEHKNYKKVARIMGRDDSMIRGYLQGRHLGPYRDFLFTRDPRDIPPSVIDDRDRRADLAPRDLTAAIFGDPPFPYSALGKKLAKETQNAVGYSPEFPRLQSVHRGDCR